MIFEPEQACLKEVIAKVERWSGCPFSGYNQGTFARRLLRRMWHLNIKTCLEYLAYLDQNKNEYQLLINSLTIKVSEFFRDKEVFEALKEHIVPAVIHNAMQQKNPMINIWSCASAFGEEAYSIAILMLEHLKHHNLLSDDIQLIVIGTDIDELAVEKAKAGIYKYEAIKDLEKGYLNYFTPVDEHDLEQSSVRITDDLKSIVTFACFDLTSSTYTTPPGGIFAEYDIVMCRNVLIYYDSTVKYKAFEKFYAALKPKGFLVLGKAENIPAESEIYFNQTNICQKIYQKNSYSTQG